MVTKKVKTKVLTNPHGANQYHLDPRQSMFLAYYLDPKSQSHGNATKSAVLAGYEKEYAETIMAKMPTWLSVKIREYQNQGLFEKAERNIAEALDLPSKVHAMGAFGPLYESVPTGKKKRVKGKLVPIMRKKPVMAFAPGLLKLKSATSMFVAERLGKGIYDPKVGPGNNVLIIQLSTQSGQRYGALPSPSQDSA